MIILSTSKGQAVVTLRNDMDVCPAHIEHHLLSLTCMVTLSTVKGQAAVTLYKNMGACPAHIKHTLLSLALMSAPASKRSLLISKCFLASARWRGVSPCSTTCPHTHQDMHSRQWQYGCNWAENAQGSYVSWSAAHNRWMPRPQISLHSHWPQYRWALLYTIHAEMLCRWTTDQHIHGRYGKLDHLMICCSKLGMMTQKSLHSFKCTLLVQLASRASMHC